ncbi:hypothetical protein MNBD_NITROSPIRAE01-1829 [hydrothermal vent metagenome]|uniref:Lipoprotein n=1 Tax=hydrothermal vent metagenome TaxID=652676 RepID=A0A3B1DAV4_9ZZZZ
MKFLGLIVLIFLSGCATHFTSPSKEALKQPFPPIQEQTSTALYLPSFTNDAIHQGGVAILGILKGGPDVLRQNAAFEFFQGLREVFPSARIVPRSDVIRRARTAGRYHDLNHFLEQYERRRRMDISALSEWGRLEGVRYLFFAQVPVNDKHTKTVMPQYGEDGIAGKVFVFSSGPEQLPSRVEKRVSLEAEVWDAVCGKLVWSGSGQAEISEAVRLERVRVDDIFTSITRRLIGEMDRTMWESGKAADSAGTGCSSG